MEALMSLSRLIDGLSERVGKAISWLVLVAVVVSTLNALVRYAFNYSSNAFLEIQWYLFATIFLLGASWTLKRNEHIRIDVVVGRFSPRVHAWIDVFGGLVFLLPLCIVILYNGFPFALEAMRSGEVSSNAGGLIVWPAKLLIPIGFTLLLLQCFSEVVKRFAYLGGLIDGKEFLKAGGHGVDADEIKKEIEAIAAANNLKVDALGIEQDKK